MRTVKTRPNERKDRFAQNCLERAFTSFDPADAWDLCKWTGIHANVAWMMVFF
jgi:hypothetical protein